MTAQAEQMAAGSQTPVVTARAEHISIEADDDAQSTPAHRRSRKVRSTYSLVSRLRGCETELSILDEHYLSVRTVRPHEPPRNYELDLRFANAKPVRVRKISWFWLGLAGSLALLAGAALWTMGSSALERWSEPVFIKAIATLLAGGGALFLFLRRTTESLEFTSVHGDATLISVTGGIGSARAGKRFFIELIKNINAAKLARPQPRPQFLRDEMREHHRLRELGVLSQQQYERSKAHILSAHRY